MKANRLLVAAALVLATASGVPAQEPDPQSQVARAVALISGDGVKKDVRAGVELLQKAAAAESPLAMRLLGDIYSSGRLVQKDEPLALALYQKAAAAGDPDALSEIGMRHTLGWGLPRNDDEGVRHALKASAAGDIAATMYLASRYEAGRGVPKDPTISVQLFRKAADAGSALGMCHLADMHRWGKGTAKDAAEAYRWYSAALLATPKPRTIRPVDFVALGKNRKQCENNRKDAGKELTAEARTAAEQWARQWLATVRYPVNP